MAEPSSTDTRPVVPIWQEPVRGGYSDPSVLGFTGLERMRLTLAGRTPAPPMHHLTGLRPVDAGPGSSTFSMPASPWWQTPAGLFSAGTMAFVADAPLGTAIATSLPPGRLLVTSDLSMNYLRPASTRSGELIGRANLIHTGARVALSEIRVEDAAGRLLAHGTTRCFLFDPLPVTPEPPDPESLPPYRPTYDTPDPWQRPVQGEVVPPEVWDELGGLEVYRKLIAGELPAPPIHHFTGGRFTEVREGRAVFVQPATEWLNSPARALYGGAIAWIVDTALAGAVHTTVPARAVFAPLDLKVNFVRPVFPDMRELTAEATVTHRGRSLAVASCELLNADGKPVAVGTSSSIILPGRQWSGGEVAPEDEAPDDAEEPE
ncbi:MAG TPA: PaaI family thioesterase [Actinomycetota bacterium]|nr:PaaI family thioesterase [Actinomycetota bacterium]